MRALRVYVSSTFSELQTIRQHVLVAISKLQPAYVTVAMEHYPARSETALQKCIDDVHDCDLYVGILGFRYGSIVPKHEKSFTHLEYEAARDAGKSCLFFLLRAPPAELPTDALDRERIEAFRATVMARHMPRMVDAAETIGVDVLASLFLKALEGGRVQPSSSTRRNTPHLLPYTCNRTRQRQDLQALSVPADTAIPIALVHGARAQLPEKFGEWLGDGGLLGQLLGKQEVVEFKPHWPQSMADDTAFVTQWTRNLAMAVSMPAHSPIDEVIEHMGRWPTDYFLSVELPLESWQLGDTSVAVESWTRGEPARLRALCRFFASWPRTGRRPRMVLLFVRYLPSPVRRFWHFGLAREAAVNKDVANTITSLGRDKLLQPITRLDDVVESDVLTWSSSPSVRAYLPDDDLEPEVRTLFEERASYPMREISDKLRTLLKNQRSKGAP